jgi:hypothetical protein
MIVFTKHSSLQHYKNNYAHEMVSEHMALCYKTCYVHNLQLLIISWSIDHWQAFPT